MTAWEEIAATGRPGSETIRLMVRVAAQTGINSGFPPPEGHRYWDDAAAIDFIAAMIDTKSGTDFIISLATMATDQDSFERLLRRTLHNWMIDLAKSTVSGRMRRRLATLLSDDPRFVRADHALGGVEGWALAGTENPWQGDEEQLFNRGLALPAGTLTALNTAGRTSAANKRTIADFAEDLLRLAGGALRAQLIARIVISKFDLNEAPTYSGADPELMRSDDTDVERTVLQHEIRDAILSNLTGRDYVVLAMWEMPETLAGRFGADVPTAENWIREVFDRIRPFCSRGEDGAAGLRLAIDECSRRI